MRAVLCALLLSLAGGCAFTPKPLELGTTPTPRGGPAASKGRYLRLVFPDELAQKTLTERSFWTGLANTLNVELGRNVKEVLHRQSIAHFGEVELVGRAPEQPAPGPEVRVTGLEGTLSSSDLALKGSVDLILRAESGRESAERIPFASDGSTGSVVLLGAFAASSRLTASQNQAMQQVAERYSEVLKAFQTGGVETAAAAKSAATPAAETPRLATPLAPKPIVAAEPEIPPAVDRRPDAVAVVIGNRSYRHRDVPPVEYAKRDAEAVRRHLVQGFGYDSANVIFVEDATLSDFHQIFGAPGRPKGKLFDWVKPGRSDVFVYYTGHGAPDLQTQGAYFVPSDADPNYIANGGYALDLFWANLAEVPAKSITVVLDACFSGNSEKGFLLTNVSPALIKVKRQLAGPAGSVVMTSAAPDQVSSWYPEKQHSLFTYWWLEGIRGGADADGDGAVTVGEMQAYLGENVTYQARRLSGREQKPVVVGVPSSVLIRLR